MQPRRTPPCLAGPGRFDGRVKSEQVRLAGDGRDHGDHITDLAHGLAEFLHQRSGLLSLDDGVACQVLGARDLPADLIDRCA